MSHEQVNTARAFLIVILLMNFFQSVGSSILTIGLPSYILLLSGTLVSYGIVIGVYSITSSILQFPMASASDKFGRKKIIIFGLGIYTLGAFLCYLAQDIGQLIIFRAIQGAGAYSSILEAIIGDSFKKEDQGKGMAYYSVSYTIGLIGGLSIGGYLSYFFGFRNIFLITGILAIISGVLFLTLFKEFRKVRASDCEKVETIIKNHPIKLSDIKTLLKNSQFRVSVLMNSIRWTVFGGIMTYLIWVFEVQFGLNEIDASYFLLLIVGVYISFVVFTGKLVDRFGARRILVVGEITIMAFGSLYLVNVANELLIFIIASVFSGLGFGMFETAGNTQLLKKIEEVNPLYKGCGFGVNNTFCFLLGAISPIVLSILGEISVFLPYYFILTFIIISFLITIKFVKS